MSPGNIIVIAVLIGGLVLLLALGLEIAWSLLLVGAIGLVFFVRQSPDQLAWLSFRSLNVFAYSAVPLFVLMGSLLFNSGINEYFFNGIAKWTGFLPGGLVSSTVVGNAVFGAMCGSTVAATATFGKVAFPVMEKQGYNAGLALGSIAAGSILAPLIPPSILLIIYGTWQGASIIRLLAGGLVPGIMLMALYLVTITIRVKLNPSLVPPAARVSWAERLSATWGLVPFVLLIAGVLGVIFGGVMTATEAAAMGVFLALVLTLAYRRLTMLGLKMSLLDAVKVTSFGMFVLVGASALSHVLNSAGIVPAVKDFVVGLPIGKYGFLVLFILMYAALGTLMDAWSMLFLTFPLVMPIIKSLGFDPVWWGVIYVMAGEQSTITPPFGLSLFVLRSVTPQHSIETIARGAAIFLIPVYINIAILTVFPQVVLWLPRVLFD